MSARVADLIAQLESRGFRRAPHAKTPAFFAGAACADFDASLRQLLRQLAEADGRSNVRLCLHQSPADDFHDMVILEWPRRRYYRPHRHPEKGETIHLIEGEAAVLVFDDRGALQSGRRLAADGTKLVRIGAGCWHTLLPLSHPVLYHEAKKGPFLGEADAEYPAWAPDGEDPQAAADYLRSLQQQAERT